MAGKGALSGHGLPWPVWLSWLVRAHAQVSGSIPVRMCEEGSWSMSLPHMGVSLSLSFSLPFFLKSIKTYLRNRMRSALKFAPE